MVLLWCMRNGLKHCEVSALDGTCVRMALNFPFLKKMNITVSLTLV
jgi:hypothetical protein